MQFIFLTKFEELFHCSLSSGLWIQDLRQLDTYFYVRDKNHLGSLYPSRGETP